MCFVSVGNLFLQVLDPVRSKEQGRTTNGVAVWSSFALDPTTNMLFFDTGNNYTGQATPLSDSMIAANAATGSLIWSQQAPPAQPGTRAQCRARRSRT